MIYSIEYRSEVTGTAGKHYELMAGTGHAGFYLSLSDAAKSAFDMGAKFVKYDNTNIVVRSGMAQIERTGVPLFVYNYPVEIEPAAEQSLESFVEDTSKRAARIMYEKEVTKAAEVLAQLWLTLTPTQQGAVIVASGNEDFGVTLYRLVYAFKDKESATTANPHGQREW